MKALCFISRDIEEVFSTTSFLLYSSLISFLNCGPSRLEAFYKGPAKLYSSPIQCQLEEFWPRFRKDVKISVREEIN